MRSSSLWSTQVLDMYDRIKLDPVDRVFKHSRVDPDYLFAHKQLNAQQKQQFAAEG